MLAVCAGLVANVAIPGFNVGCPLLDERLRNRRFFMLLVLYLEDIYVEFVGRKSDMYGGY